MKTFLIKTTETHRLANETEVEAMLKELKSNPDFEIAKYTSTKKEVKQKGEVVDEYIRFEVTKIFNDEKDPFVLLEPKYQRNGDVVEEDASDEF